VKIQIIVTVAPDKKGFEASYRVQGGHGPVSNPNPFPTYDQAWHSTAKVVAKEFNAMVCELHDDLMVTTDECKDCPCACDGECQV